MPSSLSFGHGALLLLGATLAISGTPPGFPPSLRRKGCLKEDGQPNLFCPGDDGYGCFKIPTLLRTQNGTLLAMIEARKYSCDDAGYIDLRLRRSFDDGKTWGPSILVHGNSTEKVWTTVGDGNMVEDKSTGIIWLLHTRNNSQLFLSSSRDQGATWSEPKDITATCKAGYPTQGWIGTGHAAGSQLASGRLVIPTYSAASYVVYSDDHGESWHMGGGVPGYGGTENAVAELGNGSLIMGLRHSCAITEIGCGRRWAYSDDAGMTWGAVTENRQIPEPLAGCEGSLVYHPVTKKLYFSHPDPELKLFRTRLAVWSSSDYGRTWDKPKLVWPLAAGYSSMVAMPDGKLGMLYDRNNHTLVVFEAQSVSFTTVDMESSSSEVLQV